MYIDLLSCISFKINNNKITYGYKSDNDKQ